MTQKTQFKHVFISGVLAMLALAQIIQGQDDLAGTPTLADDHYARSSAEETSEGSESDSLAREFGLTSEQSTNDDLAELQSSNEEQTDAASEGQLKDEEKWTTEGADGVEEFPGGVGLEEKPSHKIKGKAKDPSDAIAKDGHKVSIGSNENGLGNIQLDIPLKGKTVHFELQENMNMPKSIPLYIATEKFAHVQVTNLTGINVYQDASKQASFIAWDSGSDADMSSGMMGMFQEDGRTYSVESKPRTEQAPKDFTRYGKKKTVTVNNLSFDVKEITEVDDTDQMTDAVLFRAKDKAFADEDASPKKKSTKHRRKRSFHNYEVELMLIIDYSIFRKWERQSKAYYYRDREQDAIDNIRFYFAHILNGMDLRFRTIREYDYQVTLRPVGMYIAKTPSSSFWTEYNSESAKYVRGFDALEELEEWINSDGNKLPSFDQVTLFTAYQPYGGYYSEGRQTFNGIAEIQGICGNFRASICYDRGQFSSIQTGTHELGHSLGAFHDGYDNGCSGRDQYIMANAPGEVYAHTRDNQLKFSYCSLQDIREHMNRLTIKGDNCLLHRSNYYADRSHSYYLYEFPGQRYSADEQCKFAYGQYSFYCGGGHLDDGICQRMYCYDTYKHECVYTAQQQGADGTMCGKSKWCQDRQCVYDSRAPYTDKTSCFYGDYRDVIKVAGGRSFQCKYIEPHKCYDDEYNTKCCETCERIRNTDNPSCEYGDRDPDHCRRMEPRDCYDANMKSMCCETCERMKRTDEPQCEYGDKAQFCYSIRADECYQGNTTCCDSCRRFQRSRPGCEYGNRVQWCSNFPSRSCYQESYRQQCCETCCTRKTGSDDCPWGDRVSSCTQRDCSNPSRWHNCCYTCASAAWDGCQDNENDRSWCSRRRPRDCYDSYTARTCCRTCRNLKRGPSSCPYGDRYSWCGSQHCRLDARHCCESCPAPDTC